MKWDYASVGLWGRDETGPSGQNLFDLDVVELAKSLGGEVEKAEALNGYQLAFKIVRDGEKLVHCLTSGTGNAIGSSQFIAASMAHEVYPILRRMFPQHSVSRLDAAEDYTGPEAWATLEAMLTKVCGQYGVSMSPYGEGHTRPDGSRDSIKGRSWYCGSKASPFRIVLYEKGKEELAKGIVSDPNKVRIEVRVRPKSDAKRYIGSLPDLLPADLYGFSRWGKAVGEHLGMVDLKRVAIGAVWKPNEQEQLAMKIVRMFDNGIERMIENYTPEEFGKLIYSAHQLNREAKMLLAAEAA